MGNLCGKSSGGSDPFARPGRVLGSAPSAPSSNARASIPAHVSQSQKRSSGRPVGGGQSQPRSNSPRAAAARAAEERAKKTQPAGKMAEQLDAQKRQTRTETLAQASRENRRMRDADAAAEARNWN